MKLIFWENRIKPHLVPDSLVAAIGADIEKRYGFPALDTRDKNGQCLRIDEGGAILADAKWVGADIEGTKLEVMVRDIEGLYLELLKSRARVATDGQRYYKLHSWMYCVVVTAEQRTQLLAAWADTMAEHLAAADAEELRFRQALEAQRHAVQVADIIREAGGQNQKAN